MGERKLAVELFNRAWELMRRAERTAAEDDELLHVAHASRYHWIAAREGAVKIAEAEERELVLADLATIPLS